MRKKEICCRERDIPLYERTQSSTHIKILALKFYIILIIITDNYISSWLLLRETVRRGFKQSDPSRPGESRRRNTHDRIDVKLPIFEPPRATNSTNKTILWMIPHRARVEQILANPQTNQQSSTSRINFKSIHKTIYNSSFFTNKKKSITTTKIF